MRSFLLNPYLSIVLRLIVGLVFIYAAFPKIMDLYDFSVTIRNYQLVPPQWTNIIAIILPWLEIYAGIFLIIGLYIKTNARILIGMTVIFLIALSSALIRGLDISCGCFSASDSTGLISIWRIIEDVVLLVMLVQINLVHSHIFELKPKEVD